MALWPDCDGLIDLGLASTVAAIELADMFLFNAGVRHDLADAALLVGSAAALLLRRSLPLICALLAAAATVALAIRGAPHIGLAAIAASYAVASFASARERAVAGLVLVIGVWLVPLLTADSDSIPRNVALFGGAWILGHLTRERRVQHTRLVAQAEALVAERQEKLALAAAAERSELAGEVHDVLTHSVSVMVIQAQGAQALHDDPARVRLALARIEQTGRAALDDLRDLLRDLGSDDAPRSPQPDLRRIDDLARTTRESGIEVRLAVEIPDRPLSPTLQLSAYRIVQEALTNVLRHSGAHTAAVAVRCHERTLEIEVTDDGHGIRSPIDEARGIAGMRQRATAGGGSLEARRLEDGGFRVLAHLPIVR